MVVYIGGSMIVAIFIGILLIYMILVLYVIFTVSSEEEEMFEGKPRYVHTADGWYGEAEFWDRKKKRYIYV